MPLEELFQEAHDGREGPFAPRFPVLVDNFVMAIGSVDEHADFIKGELPLFDQVPGFEEAKPGLSLKTSALRDSQWDSQRHPTLEPEGIRDDAALPGTPGRLDLLVGFLGDRRYVLADWDAKCEETFRSTLKQARLESIHRKIHAVSKKKTPGPPASSASPASKLESQPNLR